MHVDGCVFVGVGMCMCTHACARVGGWVGACACGWVCSEEVIMGNVAVLVFNLGNINQ